MKKRYIIEIILLLIFIGFTYFVVTNNITKFDDIIYNSIFSIRNNFWDFLLKTITILGNTIPIICIVIILLLKLDKKNQYILGITTIATVLSNTIIKHIIMRPRPDHLRLIKQGGYSYPSGHSMIGVAVYGFLIYYCMKNIKDKKLKIISILLLSLLIIGIGISRIYVGVHFPSDVLAGYSLALLILIIVINQCDNHFKGE